MIRIFDSILHSRCFYRVYHIIARLNRPFGYYRPTNIKLSFPALNLEWLNKTGKADKLTKLMFKEAG